MTLPLDELTTAKMAVELAHQGEHWAALGTVRQSGGQLADRPMLRNEPAIGPGAADAEPLPRLAAAVQFKLAVSRVTAEYARQAREEVHSSPEVGVALELKTIPDASVDIAQIAYEHLADTHSSWRPAFAWVYPACRDTVLDRGPEPQHPADCESRHADGSPRLAAVVTAWHAAPEDAGGGGQP